MPKHDKKSDSMTKQKPEDPGQHNVVRDTAVFKQTSTNRYLVSLSRLIDIEGAKTVYSTPFQDDIGDSLVLVGCQTHSPLGEIELGIQISMDGDVFTNTIAKVTFKLDQKGKIVDCVNLDKYRAPFYRLAMKLDKPAPKGACVKLSYCAYN